MTTYPAISLHQPGATLCVTPAPLLYPKPGGYVDWPMVKRFVTRSRPCPPKHIGQRIAIHAAKRVPDVDEGGFGNIGGEFGIDFTKTIFPTEPGHPWHPLAVGDWYAYQRPNPPGRVETVFPLPLGAVAATAVVARSLPILALDQDPSPGRDEWVPHIAPARFAGLVLWDYPGEYIECVGRYGWKHADISDQLLYGDWTPGRWAWELTDVEPLAEPVPWKGRQGWFTVELP